MPQVSRGPSWTLSEFPASVLQRAVSQAGVSDSFAVCGVGCGAVCDVLFDGAGACGVVEEPLLFSSVHQAEQVAGLLEVVVVVFTKVVVLCSIPGRLGRFGIGALFGPASEVVGLDPGYAAVVAVDAHCTVAVVGVDECGCSRVVDRDLVVVDADSVPCCVPIGEQASLAASCRGCTRSPAPDWQV